MVEWNKVMNNIYKQKQQEKRKVGYALGEDSNDECFFVTLLMKKSPGKWIPNSCCS